MPEAAEIVARAVAAARRGFPTHADNVLRHAVHAGGHRPFELILAALSTPPETIHLPIGESQPMKVIYRGPSSEGVKVVHADPAAPDANTVTLCPPGEAVDLPDEIARSLVDAGVLEPAGVRRRPKPTVDQENS